MKSLAYILLTILVIISFMLGIVTVVYLSTSLPCDSCNSCGADTTVSTSTTTPMTAPTPTTTPTPRTAPTTRRVSERMTTATTTISTTQTTTSTTTPTTAPTPTITPTPRTAPTTRRVSERMTTATTTQSTTPMTTLTPRTAPTTRTTKPQPVNCPIESVPLLRLYRSLTLNHFYTTSDNESKNAIANLQYKKEYSPGRVALTATDCLCESKLTPIFRRHRSFPEDHFYTANEIEANNAERYYYHAEGIAFYCSPNKNECGASVPLYRFFRGTEHFYTDSFEEGQNNGVIRGGSYEGILCYIWK